jgi:hypothetical protein
LTGGNSLRCGLRRPRRDQVEADVLRGLLGISEEDGPVIFMDHPPVVSGDDLLELRGVEESRFLAQRRGRKCTVTLGAVLMTSPMTAPTWLFMSVNPVRFEVAASDLNGLEAVLKMRLPCSLSPLICRPPRRSATQRRSRRSAIRKSI